MATTARKRTRDTSTRRPAKATAASTSAGSTPGRILRNAAMARRVADALLDAAGYDPRRVAAALRAAEGTLAEHPELLDAVRAAGLPDAEPVDVMLALARQAILRADTDTSVQGPAEADADGDG